MIVVDRFNEILLFRMHEMMVNGFSNMAIEKV